MAIISSIAHAAIPVTDTSQVGEARRTAKTFSEQLRFDEEQSGRLAIVVTEAATNLARHAREGEILLCPCAGDTENYIDVIAIDRGPGIPDIARSLEDGFSTAGTAGNGLGAIRRLSDKAELYSQGGTGTVLLARITAGGHPRPQQPAGFAAAFLCFPKKGERLSGDTVALKANNRHAFFMVADGLGHGVSANQASAEAAKIFLEERDDAPAGILGSVNQGLRATRGAAVAIASLDSESRKLRYSGIGNIAGAVFQGDASRGLMSHNGIVGSHAHRLHELQYDWPRPGLLVMNSDGLVSNWRLTPYPGLQRKDPAVIAAVLYRDFNRGRDDVAILVVKEVVADA